MRVYNNTTAPGSRPAFQAGPVTVNLDGTDDVVVEFKGSGTISNVRHSPGSIDLGFALVSVADELRACQRYYYRKTAVTNQEMFALGGVFTSVPQFNGEFFFPVTMRARPFLEASAGNTFQVHQPGKAIITASTLTDTSAGGTSTTSMYLNMLISSGAGFADGGWARLQSLVAGAYIGADAEMR
jgi:hypothetical protein